MDYMVKCGWRIIAIFRYLSDAIDYAHKESVTNTGVSFRVVDMRDGVVIARWHDGKKYDD